MSASGVQYTRNVQDVKIAPNSEDVDGSESTSKTTSEVTLESKDSSLGEQSTISEDNRNLRKRNDLRRPARFDSDYVYHIFY